MNMENEEAGVVVRGRVEIDMRQPFRSVKEAVSLFGEKVLAGEIYASKLKEGGGGKEQGGSKVGRVTSAEPHEETKQSLGKSKEERNLMAYYLHSLQKELEQTKKELQRLKSSRELSDNIIHSRPPPLPLPTIENEIIEELKFTENSTTKTEANTQNSCTQEFVLEKKRSVKFASPPLLTRVIISKDDQMESSSSPSSVLLEKKPKRKPLIPALALLFSRKKGHQKSGGAGTLRA